MLSVCVFDSIEKGLCVCIKDVEGFLLLSFLLCLGVSSFAIDDVDPLRTSINFIFVCG